MENVKLAEQEFKDLIMKYPDLEFFIVPNYSVGFKPREVMPVVETVAPTSETPIESPIIDAVTFDPTNPQPEVNETTETA